MTRASGPCEHCPCFSNHDFTHSSHRQHGPEARVTGTLNQFVQSQPTLPSRFIDAFPASITATFSTTSRSGGRGAALEESCHSLHQPRINRREIDLELLHAFFSLHGRAKVITPLPFHTQPGISAVVIIQIEQITILQMQAR